MTPLEKYLQRKNAEKNSFMVSYVSSLQNVALVSPKTACSIVKELESQRTHLKLIASENFSSISVQSAFSNLLTDKYAEGYPYHRFYAGCDNIDDIEANAAELACRLFSAEHAYVQPHSGADANLCAYWAILNHKIITPELEKLNVGDLKNISESDWKHIRMACGNQKLLGLDYYSGGHLTHGYRYNVSAQMFDSYSYSVDRDTGLLSYDEIQKKVQEIKPLILLAGYSAYPRKINFKIMKEIADSSGAVLMVDMAHFAGLVAGKIFTDEFDPVKYADVVTSTTHKTLRGPRGGLVLCKEEYAESVDKGCPLVLGGPLGHVIAAKAVAFKEALKPEFCDYASQIVKNSSALAKYLMEEGLDVVTKGTDNHIVLVDVSRFGINGRQAESVLRECGLTLNRNALPFDKNGPWYTSGLRIGTPAVTTLGMKEKEMKKIAHIISMVLKSSKPKLITKGENAGTFSKTKCIVNDSVKKEAISYTSELLEEFKLYPELDLDFLKENFVTEV